MNHFSECSCSCTKGLVDTRFEYRGGKIVFKFENGDDRQTHSICF